jgi:hypothetical protein
MRTLRKKLKEFLRLYEVRSRRLTPERIIEDPGIDYSMNETVWFREELEKQKILLLPQEKKFLQEADLRFLTTWEKVKNIEPETPHNKIAKAFLKDIVEIIKKSQEPHKTKTKASAKRRVSF